MGPEWRFTTGNILAGDVNDDKTVDLSDALVALQAVGGLNPAALRADYRLCGADADGDGKLGPADAIHIVQTIAALRPATGGPP